MSQQLELSFSEPPDLTHCLHYQYSCAPAINGVYTTMYVRDWTGPRYISSDGKQYWVGDTFRYGGTLYKVREVNYNIQGTKFTEIFAETME